MSPVGVIADSLVRRVDPEGRRHRARAASLWAGVAGPEVQRHTRGFAYTDGELVVFVDCPAWAQELSLMADDYRGRLNQDMEKDPVRSVRFSVSRRAVGSWGRAEDEAREPGPRPPEALAPAPLDEREKRHVQRAVAGIGDPSIRQTAGRILAEDLGMRKARRKGSRSTGRTGPVSSGDRGLEKPGQGGPEGS